MNTKYITNETSFNGLPNQKVSYKAKKKKWRRDSLNYYIDNVHTSANDGRKTAAEIEENRNYFNSIVDDSQLQDAFDPLGLGQDEQEYSKDYEVRQESYNMIKGPLTTLSGEEYNRRNEVKAIAVDDGNTSEKDREFKKRVNTVLQEHIKSKVVDEDKLKKQLEELDKWKKFDLATATEKLANTILKAYKNNQDLSLEEKFNDAFLDLTTINESIVRVGTLGEEPWIFPVDNSNLHVYGIGQSKYVEEGYAWIEQDWMTPNQIVEEFYEYLSDKEIDRLFELSQSDEANESPVQIMSPYIQDPSSVTNDDTSNEITTNIQPDDKYRMVDFESNDHHVNSSGEIKVCRTQWISLRKIGKLQYYDAFGDEQTKWVDEEYPINEEAGEQVEWLWVDELWTGVRIGAKAEEIYPYIQPAEIQMRNMFNPSKVFPSYIGVINKFKTNKTKSILDDLKVWQDDFNVWMYKLKSLWVKNMGRVGVIDVSRIPSDMDTEEWFKWLNKMGLVLENPFEESKRGQVSGHMQQNSSVIDLSLANEIQQAVQMLEWLEQKINQVAAVPEARQGDMEGNEGLGVTRQAIASASNKTEYIYRLFDNFKTRAYTRFLQYAKNIWRDKKELKEFVLDDLSRVTINLDGEKLFYSEFMVQLTNGTKLKELENDLREMSHAAMQNGVITMSDIAEMKMTSSPYDMIAKLKEAEEKRIEQQQQAQKSEIQDKKESRQHELKKQDNEHKNKMDEIDREGYWSLREKEMDLQENATETILNNKTKIEQQEMENENKDKELDVKGEEVNIKNKEADIKKEETKQKQKENNKQNSSQ